MSHTYLNDVILIDNIERQSKLNKFDVVIYMSHIKYDVFYVESGPWRNIDVIYPHVVFKFVKYKWGVRLIIGK